MGEPASLEICYGPTNKTRKKATAPQKMSNALSMHSTWSSDKDFPPTSILMFNHACNIVKALYPYAQASYLPACPAGTGQPSSPTTVSVQNFPVSFGVVNIWPLCKLGLSFYLEPNIPNQTPLLKSWQKRNKAVSLSKQHTSNTLTGAHWVYSAEKM